MILVDTSVLIDLFKGNENGVTDSLRKIIQQQIPFGITSVVYQEILQGAKTKQEYNLLNDYLCCQRFFHPKDPLTSYERAASIYFECRKQGITIRSTIDCLIAQTAIEYDLFLLHNDRDFINIASVVNLNLYSSC